MKPELEKGQKISLSRESPSLRNILVGLGWDLNISDGAEFDLDAEAFLLDASGKVPADDCFIFYNNRKSRNGAVEHLGDNRQGGSVDEHGRKMDDERIMIELDRVPESIARIVFAVSIYKAEDRRQSFGLVRNAYIRILDTDRQIELCRFSLSDASSRETAIVFGEVYRHHGEWRFGAVGQGYAGGLRPLAVSFGVDVA